MNNVKLGIQLRENVPVALKVGILKMEPAFYPMIIKMIQVIQDNNPNATTDKFPRMESALM